MDFDLESVNNCNVNTSTLRFYGWSPYCISIGANQSFKDINLDLTLKDNIDVVQRPTGGRAILHAEELTYSVILPNTKEINGNHIYEQISLAIVAGLKKFNSKLENVSLEKEQPNFSDLLKKSDGAICFASTAQSEIKFLGKKLVGSAQRKIGTNLLQHGSILIGSYHKNLVKYLNIDDEKKEILNNRISQKTITLSEILNCDVSDINIETLQNYLIEGFNEVFNSTFVSPIAASIGS